MLDDSAEYGTNIKKSVFITVSMEDKKKAKIAVILAVASCWIVLISGLIRVPIEGWLILTGITFIMYFALTRHLSYRKGKLRDVVEDLEEYTEVKAEETEIEEIKKKVEELEEETGDEDQVSSRSSLEQSSTGEEKKEDK